MPRFLQPKKSTQHRVAAIALYRALLSQCSTVSLPDENRSSLRNAIRNSFRKNRKLQSPRQLGLVFQAGYETLDELDASTTGDSASTSSLTSLISSLPQGLKRPPGNRRQPQPFDSSKQQLACLPPEKAVLNVRPHAKVSGTRRVPILASANGIPFLRITKPQPPALSRIIRQKLETRNRRFDHRVLLNNYWTPLGRYEDQWDAILARQFGMGITEGGYGTESWGEPKWVDVMVQAGRENLEAYERDMARDRETTRKMMRIVDEETKLAEAEGVKVVRGRKGRPIRSRWLK